jgi:hypothetical protein
MLSLQQLLDYPYPAVFRQWAVLTGKGLHALGTPRMLYMSEADHPCTCCCPQK